MFLGYTWAILPIENVNKRLLTISTRDPDIAIYGYIPTGELSSSWQKYKHFRQSADVGTELLPLDINCANVEYRNFLHKEFREWRIHNTSLKKHHMIYNDFSGWQRAVVNWYNQRVSVESGFCKQLYLWGTPDTGKTRFLNYLILSKE